jgi:hypothetical protein
MSTGFATIIDKVDVPGTLRYESNWWAFTCTGYYGPAAELDILVACPV